MVYPEGGYDQFDYESNDVSMNGNAPTTEFYSEEIFYKLNTYSTHTNDSQSQSLVIATPTAATISVGGGCHGTCGWTGSAGSCERAPASVTFQGPGTGLGAYVNIGWSCPTASNVTEVVLNPGTYSINLHADYNGDEGYSNTSISIVLHKQRPLLPSSYSPVGGVRVKRIKRYSYPQASPKVTRFIYKTTVGGQQFSSGALVRKPFYYGRYSASTRIDESGTTILCPYDAGFAFSRVSLGEGTHVGYGEVKVLNGENGGERL